MKPVLACVWLGWSSACYFFFRWRSVRWFEWKNNEECCVAVGRTANISRSVSTSHVVSLVVLLFHWLSCCFIGCLVVSLLSCCFIGCLVVSFLSCCFIGCLVVSLVVMLYHWLSCCFIGCLVVSLVVLLFHWLSCCFVGSLVVHVEWISVFSWSRKLFVRCYHPPKAVLFCFGYTGLGHLWLFVRVVIVIEHIFSTTSRVS